MNRRSFVGTLGAMLLGLVEWGCGKAVAVIDALVAAAEAAIRFIPGLSAADKALAVDYLNAVLKITGDMLTCGAVPACVSKAITDFQNLVVPNFSSSIPGVALAAINAVAAAILSFIAAYTTAPPAALAAAKAKAAKGLSAKDAGKIAGWRVRIDKAKLALATVK